MKTSARIYLGGILAAALLGLLLYFLPSHKPPLKQALGERNAHDSATTSDHRPHLRNVARLASKTPAKRIPVADDGTVAVPARYQLPGVARVHSTAANFDDWLKQYPAVDRERIKAFDTRYNGVYEIASPQQIAWMAQNGYPMPEDLIAAEGIDDATLRNLADHGNDKAGFLLHQRDVDRLDGPMSKLDISTPEGMALAQAIGEDYNLLSAPPSPFKGYVEAADSFRVYDDPMVQKSRLISGLLRASDLGDSRADYVLNEYIGNGMISDQEYVIATRVLLDAQSDRNFIAGAKCPQFSAMGSIPMK